MAGTNVVAKRSGQRKSKATRTRKSGLLHRQLRDIEEAYHQARIHASLSVIYSELARAKKAGDLEAVAYAEKSLREVQMPAVDVVDDISIMSVVKKLK